MERLNEFEFEKVLIRSLFAKNEVRQKILPHLTVDLFTDEKHQDIIKEIIEFNSKHNTFPSPNDIMIVLSNEKIEERFRLIGKIKPEEYHYENFIGKAEEFIRERLTWNQLTDAVGKLKEGKVKEIDSQKIAEAQAFNFDTSIGIDLLEDDGEKFYNDLHDEGVFVKTGLNNFDYMMNGGFRKKTFNLFVAGTNVGKTLIKCALAKQCLIQNYKVLFIPLEGTEEGIRDRIMFNLLDMSLDELKSLDKSALKDLIKKVRQSVKSKLIIKRFNQHSLNAAKLRVLLKELKSKMNFVPDIVFIDYMGLTIPNIITKESGNQASQLKKASEEFHGVAKDEDFALISSMQFNREGFKSSSPNMDDISESFGTLFTADEVILLMQTEEMRKNNKYIYKKVKARSKHKDFTGNLSVDFEKQKIFEADATFKNEQEKKKIEKMVEEESSHVDFMLQQSNDFATKRIITTDFT